MPNYRLYRLDGAGKISTAEWIEAASDEDARRDARTIVGSRSFELWDKNRLVEGRDRDAGAEPDRPKPTSN